MIWQPIATLPPDVNDTVLLFIPKYGVQADYVFIGYRSVVPGEWLDDNGEELIYTSVSPTHWMPLPGPPTA